MKIGVWEARVRGKQGDEFVTVLHPVPGDGPAQKAAVAKAVAEKSGMIVPLGVTWQTNGFTGVPVHETRILVRPN